MKAWKTLIVACAALAAAAPAANATFDRSLPSKAAQAKVMKKVHHKRLVPKIKSTTPRVLIIVAQGPTPSVADVGGDCASSGNNCTNQQLCDLWAMSCDLTAADQANSAATEANSAATDDQSTTG
jgi:hypothetical protein